MATESERERERLKKARYRARNRERLRQESAAARERERILKLADDAACTCCLESRKVFLISDTRCFNCQHAEITGICPHQGVYGRIA